MRTEGNMRRQRDPRGVEVQEGQRKPVYKRSDPGSYRCTGNNSVLLRVKAVMPGTFSGVGKPGVTTAAQASFYS